MEPKVGAVTSSDDASRGKRDAFHVPVVLVSADCVLKGGAKVVFTSASTVTSTASNSYDAIVDPFLNNVSTGSAFWVFLRPGSVSNLTHTWSSPQIPALSAPTTTEPSLLTEEESKILRIAKENNVTVEELERVANDSCRGCYE